MQINAPQISRNLGFIPAAAQSILLEATIGIAGAGGDGGIIAEQLTRLGIKELRLADPDPFEIENLNRQAFSSAKTIGTNKAAAVGRAVQEINPELRVVVYEQGITEENVAVFMDGCDLVFDETEFTMPHVGAMFAREARRQGIPNLMVLNVGFGAQLTSFLPAGRTFEDMLGLDPDMSLEDISNQHIPLERWLAYVPSYLDRTMYEHIARGHISAPTVAPGVALAGGIAATEAILHLTSSAVAWPRTPVVYNDVLVLDYLDQIMRIVSHPSKSE